MVNRPELEQELAHLGWSEDGVPVAVAILLLVDAVESNTQALHLLGTNHAVGTSMGAIESIGNELNRIADILDMRLGS